MNGLGLTGPKKRDLGKVWLTAFKMPNFCRKGQNNICYVVMRGGNMKSWISNGKRQIYARPWKKTKMGGKKPVGLIALSVASPSVRVV